MSIIHILLFLTRHRRPSKLKPHSSLKYWKYSRQVSSNVTHRCCSETAESVPKRNSFSPLIFPSWPQCGPYACRGKWHALNINEPEAKWDPQTPRRVWECAGKTVRSLENACHAWASQRCVHDKALYKSTFTFTFTPVAVWSENVKKSNNILLPLFTKWSQLTRWPCASAVYSVVDSCDGTSAGDSSATP